jgi:SAM-dependent methyltransferase
MQIDTWDYWGEKDPYFGVAGSNLSQETFWESGKQYVDGLLKTIREHISPDFLSNRVLDFGCGCGRVVIPLSDQFHKVVGLDTSESMLKEARANCTADNVQFFSGLSDLRGDFDLVHSTNVLIHIRPREGRRIIKILLSHLRPDGILILQFYARCRVNPLLRGLVRLRYAMPWLNSLRNLLKRRPLHEPAMELYVYNLTRILELLSAYSITNIHLQTWTDHDFTSLRIYGQRKGAVGFQCKELPFEY